MLVNEVTILQKRPTVNSKLHQRSHYSCVELKTNFERILRTNSLAYTQTRANIQLTFGTRYALRTLDLYNLLTS